MIKKEQAKKSIVLAIETAVEGGSLALLIDDGEEKLADGWVGNGGVSKSEDFLAQIENSLEKNRVKKSEITLIAVSNGPGSFTGVRIGVASARGLSKALGCEIAAFSVLEAMAAAEENISNIKNLNREKFADDEPIKIDAAIPFGKSQICRQRFVVKRNAPEIENIGEPEVITRAEYAERIRFDEFDRLILHESLYRHLITSVQLNDAEREKIVDAGFNLAALIGKEAQKRRCRANERQENQEQKVVPIYAGKSTRG